MALVDQINSPDSPDFRFYYERILGLGYSEIQTKERMAPVLHQYISQVMKGRKNYADYVKKLESISRNQS